DLLLVPGVFGALLLPMMANALAQGREVVSRRLSMSTTYLSALAAPLVAFGVVFAHEIIGLLYGEAFAPAAFAFAGCLAAGSIATLSQAASGYLLGADRQRALMIIVVACSLVKLALDIVLVQRYGLTGAVVAYGATSILSGVLVTGLALRYSGARLEWVRIGRVLAAAALAAAGAWAVKGHLPVVPTLVLGGATLAVLYAVCTLLLGFWSVADLRHFQQLPAQLTGRAPGVPGPRAGLGDATRGSFRMSLYERTFRHVLYPSYEALRGRGMLRHLAGYEANQWRSPDEIAAIQWSKLQALVAHCWHEVPFYRSRWEAIGFEPGDLRSMDDYARLPVLTKDDSRTHGERLKARSLRDGLRSKATGGSTGEPLRFGYTRESNDRRAAVMWRGYAWTGARMGRRALFLWGGAVGEPDRAAQMKERLYHAAYHR